MLIKFVYLTQGFGVLGAKFYTTTKVSTYLLILISFLHFADNLREVYDLCQKILYDDGDNDYATDFGLSGEGASIKDVRIF